MSSSILTCFFCQCCDEPLKLQSELLNSLQLENVYSELMLSTGQRNSLGIGDPSQPSGSVEIGTSLDSPSVIRPSTMGRPSSHSVSGISTSRRPMTTGGSHVSRLSIHSAKPHRSLDQLSAISSGSSSLSIADKKFQLSYIPVPEASDVDNVVFDSEPNQELIDRLRQLASIFDLLSSKSAHFDYPVCSDCAKTIASVLQCELDQLSSDRNAFSEFVRNVENTFNNSEASNITELAELERLQEMEQNLLKEIIDMEREHCDITMEIEKLELEARELAASEEDLWHNFSVSELTMSAYQLENESMNNNHENANALLDHLKKTNVFNDAFHIWHEGSFGTINGLRLGRLPDYPIEWTEINSGLGYACLLLDTLAQKVGFQFETYRLVPNGSFSFIEKLDDQKTQFDLFGSGGFQLSRILWNRRFDQGLAAFLECVSEFGDFARKQDPDFKFPYVIEKDHIGGISIKSQFNQDEKWTRALKYLLTDLKWLLAFCTRKVNNVSHSPRI